LAEPKAVNRGFTVAALLVSVPISECSLCRRVPCIAAGLATEQVVTAISSAVNVPCLQEASNFDVNGLDLL